MEIRNVLRPGIKTAVQFRILVRLFLEKCRVSTATLLNFTWDADGRLSCGYNALLWEPGHTLHLDWSLELPRQDLNRLYERSYSFRSKAMQLLHSKQ
jgi:hypothetical protein